jgi:undecaprenyl-phosphate 4-deoxy-4-formamido-L-arabinose transferase
MGDLPGSGVSIVVPVFRSGEMLPLLVERLGAVLRDVEHEILLVDDASDDGTWGVARDLATRDERIRALRLGRNVGQHNAQLAGIRAARMPVTVTIDDDLQHPPEEIPKLLERLAAGDVDLVYGTPTAVSQRGWRRLVSNAARRLLAGPLKAANAERMTSFRAFNTSLREGFASDVGPAVSMEALLAWSTSRFAYVDVQHDPRALGTSNYTLRSLARFALDTTLAYSARPLRIATALGFLTAGFGAVLLLFVVARYVLSGTPVTGFPFLASALAIFSGVQLLTLGIMGEYLARMHFRVMQKPTYFVAEVVGHDRDS